MRVEASTGLLVGARQVLSPFCDSRPSGVVPDLVVLHGISLPPGEFGGPWIARLFTGNLPADAHPEFRERAGLRVSAHVLIRRDGEPVQFVPFNDRAWHAGRSVWQGREACNDYSIGIELEGTDDVPYEDAQYASLAQLLPVLRAAYPAITADRIVGHSDVAPGRKTDPGPSFDWSRVNRA
jgi:AmpD protein